MLYWVVLGGAGRRVWRFLGRFEVLGEVWVLRVVVGEDGYFYLIEDVV